MTDYTALIEPALFRTLPEQGPRAHLYDLLEGFLRRGGKRIRPTICLAACEAFGGRSVDALEVAAGLELFHCAFLVHDDIEDESDQRRGEPTMHRRFGVARALNAGDAFSALGIEQVVRAAAAHPRLAAQIATEFAHLLRRTVEGQAVELGWAADAKWGISDREYLAMVRDKTCWYSVIHPLRLGALIGSAGSFCLDRLIPLGFLVGAVFQIHDDLENLLADPVTYDKDLGGDLVEAKRTLPVLHLMRTGSTAQVAILRSVLGPNAGLNAQERLAAVRPLFAAAGSVEHARSVAEALAGAAMAEMDAVFGTLQDNDGTKYLAQVVAGLHASTRSLDLESQVAWA